jgi:hypothetical protein
VLFALDVLFLEELLVVDFLELLLVVEDFLELPLVALLEFLDAVDELDAVALSVPLAEALFDVFVTVELLEFVL